MINCLKSPLFIVSSLLVIAHQFLQQVLKINIHLVDAYLDNLLAMPIILPLLEIEQACLFKQKANSQLTILTTIIATIYVSAISEFIFPALSSRFTFDAWDFVFFFIGAALHLVTAHAKIKIRA